ncbi:hypothetical protein QLG13_28120 (plasmid) [Rhodococcus aetherivorans]|uniref:hypothetical protein n=1 Tax=Rhodococcus aetherivorans TaxID=191292 RepID=UPI0012DD6775|nr:hypothetical protein [Rhodococcus aetherivorans]
MNARIAAATALFPILLVLSACSGNAHDVDTRSVASPATADARRITEGGCTNFDSKPTALQILQDLDSINEHFDQVYASIRSTRSTPEPFSIEWLMTTNEGRAAAEKIINEMPDDAAQEYQETVCEDLLNRPVAYTGDFLSVESPEWTIAYAVWQCASIPETVQMLRDLDSKNPWDQEIDQMSDTDMRKYALDFIGPLNYDGELLLRTVCANSS